MVYPVRRIALFQIELFWVLRIMIDISMDLYADQSAPRRPMPAETPGHPAQ